MPIIGIYGLICKTVFAECTIKEENSGEAFICKKSDIKSCGGVRLDACRGHVFLKMSYWLNQICLLFTTLSYQNTHVVVFKIQSFVFYTD